MLAGNLPVQMAGRTEALMSSFLAARSVTHFRDGLLCISKETYNDHNIRSYLL
jgi:hypothetical protein